MQLHKRRIKPFNKKQVAFVRTLNENCVTVLERLCQLRVPRAYMRAQPRLFPLKFHLLISNYASHNWSYHVSIVHEVALRN